MGGFFLVNRAATRHGSAPCSALSDAYSQLGFSAPTVIETPDYIFAAYPAIETKVLALIREANGDFLYVCGTCFDDDSLGCAAVARSDPCRALQLDPRDALMGHYAIVSRRNGRSRIMVDNFGAYHLYYNRQAGIISSSFFAICSALPRLTLSQQGACEYVFNGVVSGNETLFSEISVVPIGATIEIGGGDFQITCEKVKPPQSFTGATRSQSLDRSMALLDRYFAAIARMFGDRVGCALSGGYDSRLLLAFLRRHGIRPRLYVYGEAADRDVRIASEIAETEGFPLAAINKNDRPVIAPEAFAETAFRNFLAHDGYGWGGIFQNDAEIAESARRVRGGAIALNGGGGEIFRNFFYLPDREYTIRELLWSFYGRFNPSACTKLFDPSAYYRGLERKIADLVGGGERRLARPTVEWLYHRFRCRSWDGKVDSIAQRFGCTGMPYLEPKVTAHASVLPIGWKDHGDYEAELIRRADPRLAGYRSAYGHDFIGRPPLSRRIRDFATYLRPPWLRRYTYRLRYHSPRSGDWPGYLAQAYRHAVLPDGLPQTGRLFRADRIADPEQFRRILSLEYALNQFGDRIKTEF